jgi:hypothetical protein
MSFIRHGLALQPNFGRPGLSRIGGDLRSKQGEDQILSDTWDHF